MKPINIGIVGLGRAGWGMHCADLDGKRDKFRIVAACDILPERLERMHGRYPDCRLYGDIRQLIDDPEVELVDIATRSIDHYAHARMALDAGKNTLVEKPMCRTYEEALKLRGLVNRPGAPRLFARFNRRFEVSFQTIQEIIASGILGEVHEVHIARDGYNRRDDWQTLREFGGGQLLNWGPHIVDQSIQLLGAPVRDVIGDLKQTVAGGDCEDHVVIMLRGENGRTVSMRITGGCALQTPEYEVFGSRGALRIENRGPNPGKIQLRYIDPEQKLATPIADPGTPGQSFGKTGTFEQAEPIRWIEEVRTCRSEDLSIIWDHMYASIREDAPYPIPMDQAVEVIRVINLARKNTPFEL